jgi:flagellar motor switch/type III secretory pathway protein FliN
MSASRPYLAPGLRDVPIDRLGFWNALVSRTGETLPLRGSAVAVVELGAAPPDDALCLDLRLGAATGSDLRLVVHPVEFPFGPAFGAEMEVADLPLLPEALRAALLAGFVDACAVALPDHGCGALTIRANAKLADLVPSSDGADLRWFRIVIQVLRPGPIRLDLGARLDTLFQIFDPLVPRVVWPGLRQILTRVAFVTLGRLALPVRALRTLVPGAVVVLDEGVGPESLRLRSGATLFHVRPAETGWTCTAVTTDAPLHEPDETPMPLRPDLPEQTAGRLDVVPDLDVVLDLDIGSVTVPLAEIERWQAGSLVTLDLEPPRDGIEVVLRANGRRIGTGALVRIDERLAVRIVHVSLA